MSATSSPPEEAGPKGGGADHSTSWSGPHPTSPPPGDPPQCEPGVTTVEVPIGRRVMVVSDLLLTPEASPSSVAVSTELARTLDTWDGPGILVIAGNLFDLTSEGHPAKGPPHDRCARSMEAHLALREALSRFASGRDRRVIRQTGTHEPGIDSDTGVLASMEREGFEHRGPIDLHLHTANGDRVVRVEPGEHAYAPGCEPSGSGPDPEADAKPGAIGPSVAGSRWSSFARQSTTGAPWLEGLSRLSDPSSLSRFVVSRTLYRRLGRYAWWLLVPFLVAGLLRVAVTPWVLVHLGSGLPARAIRHARAADAGDQLAVAALVALVVLGVLAVVLGILSRRLWSILGGGSLDRVRLEAGANDRARDAARRLVGRGHSGLITAATFQSELTNLGIGFYANVGATAEVVEEHSGRLGLPPVFVHSRRVSWVELETGADLHARLLLANQALDSPSLLERLFDRRDGVNSRSSRPDLVASYPVGGSWPPAPDLRLAHRRARRVRRWAALAILAAGITDLLDAVTPPLRTRLHFLLEFLPLRVTEAAGALIAMSGLALLALGRGILRGQRRAWRVAVFLLATSIILHLVAGADVEESVLTVAVLALLLANRRDFQAASDWSSLRSALIALVGGVVGLVVVTTSLVELLTHVGPHRHPHLVWWTTLWAITERLAGVTTLPLPKRLNDFLSPALIALGLSIAALVLFLLTRPVVDRRLSSGRAAELRARDIVRRHGGSTLDYFSLRSDKHWFFHRDSLVAYAIYGGICLVSPDPIGPENERGQAWAAFRKFADDHGWVTAIMGAGEEWLPIYRESGMHNMYLGDEAVVNVQVFSLAGKSMKGLRQANNRIHKNGYTATFHDPAHLDPAVVEELTSLMSLSRRGEHERGFSMMLGRIFDPRDTGLLLTVVRDRDGAVAAMCQFVPAKGIDGYSLDLMRRDTGDHPNGLLDFALCSTLEHLRQEGFGGLSLNFAAMRSILSGEKGDGTLGRAERWALKRLSNFVQMESLWRFNAKYDPEWLPRYVVFDTAEHLVPVIMAILRAESMWELPVLGRLLASGAEKRVLAAQQDTEAFVGSVEAKSETRAGVDDRETAGPAAGDVDPMFETLDEETPARTPIASARTEADSSGLAPGP
ncbi:MAG: bifunctional lysylphosphatidylglycerol flippase/synthetase MprF [Acidimicrobiales bacterium]